LSTSSIVIVLSKNAYLGECQRLSCQEDPEKRKKAPDRALRSIET
jgi:hypothetical protein